MKKGFTIWFTGLPCSGKSTLANIVAEELRGQGKLVEVLDGDEVRQKLNWDLGFSKQDRDTNIKRIAFLTRILSRNGVVAIAAAISPYREMRKYAREQNERFAEIHVNCPLEECAKRDVKGMYAKAMRGEITGFTGVDDPYEAPENPELVLHTGKEKPDESAARIMARLRELKYME